jgi:hypothetical protein
VVGDHLAEEEPVEVRSGRSGQGVEAPAHVGHVVPAVVHAVHRGGGTPLIQPAVQDVDLRGLRGLDAGGQVAYPRVGGPVGGQLGHLDRALVVGQHALREGDVSGVERRVGGRLGGGAARHAGHPCVSAAVGAGGEDECAGEQCAGECGQACGAADHESSPAWWMA